MYSDMLVEDSVSYENLSKTSSMIPSKKLFVCVLLLFTFIIFLSIHSIPISLSFENAYTVAPGDEYVLAPIEMGGEVEVCTPADNVFFLKTHKTGSSTIFNILMRFADEHDRTVAFPKTRSSMLNYPRSLRPEFLLNYSVIGRTPEIFPLHCRLDIDVAKAIMPPNTKFLTIIRHPVALWESSYNYFKLSKRIGLTLDQFIADDSVIEKLRYARYGKWMGFNQMYFDMGFNETLEESPADQAQRAIDMLEANFDLVMVSEFMDQSLILMKHELCWSTENMVVFVQNARNSTVHKKEVDSNTARKLKDLNDIDMRIYNHFLTKLLKKIDELGAQRVTEEANELKQRINYWSAKCIAGFKSGFSNTIEYILADKGEPMCKRLTYKETLYTRTIKLRYANMYLRQGYKIRV